MCEYLFSLFGLCGRGTGPEAVLLHRLADMRARQVGLRGGEASLPGLLSHGTWDSALHLGSPVPQGRRPELKPSFASDKILVTLEGRFVAPDGESHPPPTWGEQQPVCLSQTPVGMAWVNVSLAAKPTGVSSLSPLPHHRNRRHLHCTTALRRRGRNSPWHGNEALLRCCPGSHG